MRMGRFLFCGWMVCWFSQGLVGRWGVGVFLRESADLMKGSLAVPKAVTNAYVNPAWRAYNEGLASLAEDAELKIADGCGHFIQRDGPEFVAGEILRVLERVGV